jgi:hypothetical protein
LTLDLGAGIVTETGQIKAVNKFTYLGSLLEATGATILGIEKRISEGKRAISMLNSVLWSKTLLHKTKKKNLCTRLSLKYYTMWGRNMDTKHTTGK